MMKALNTRARSVRSGIGIAAAALAVVGLAQAASGQVVYETGFELPDFVAGELLAGQGGWLVTPVGGGSESEFISTERPFEGDQSVKLDSSLSSDDFSGAGIAIEMDPRDLGQTQAVVSAHIYVQPGVGDNEIFGLQVYAQRDPVTRLLPSNAGAGISQEGEIWALGQDAGTGVFVDTERWIFLEVVIDTTTATFSVRADGATVIEGLDLLSAGSDGTVGGFAIAQVLEGAGDSVAFVDEPTLSAVTPCAPDIDGDGRLTIFDFLGFQNLFDAGDARADFDGDGELTLFDFLAFQNAFDAGCD